MLVFDNIDKIISVLAFVFVVSYLIYSFILGYHFIRFGIGSKPKILALIYFVGSIFLLFILSIVYLNLEISNFLVF